MLLKLKIDETGCLFDVIIQDFMKTITEPRHEKTRLLHYGKTKKQISCAVTAQLIGTFVSATRIVQLLDIFPKFQASSLLL